MNLKREKITRFELINAACLEDEFIDTIHFFDPLREEMDFIDPVIMAREIQLGGF